MPIYVERRQLVALLASSAFLVTPLAAFAQRGSKVPTVGILWHAGSAEQEGPYFKAMVEGFAALGYIDGRNIKLEHRFPNETPERFKSMAAELVRANVDVLIGVGATASVVVKNATTTIPVVFTLAANPVASKLVESLARPGGNVTGLSNMSVDLSTKRLQLLMEAISGLSRVALLVNPSEPPVPAYIAEGEAAASQLGVTQQVFEARALDEIEPAFDAMAKAQMQAVVLGAGGLLYQARRITPKLAVARRLPVCAWSKETFEDGALMSYGADQLAIIKRTAALVDKILKGARPAEIPVEQPSRLQLLLNLKTAKAIGLEISPAVLARADDVIE